jgi:hypothetical protein
MIGKKDKTIKLIGVIFVLVLIFIGALYMFRNNIFQYIDDRVSVDKTSSELTASRFSQDMDLEKDDLLSSDLFDRPKFKNLKRNSVSLPRFSAGKSNPFQPF